MKKVYLLLGVILAVSVATSIFNVSESVGGKESSENKTMSDFVTQEQFETGLSAWLPCGTIVMWSGEIGEIPDGWTLCDGTNDTPDLRARFVVGADESDYYVGDTGGENEVTLTQEEMPAHTHGVNNLTVASAGAHVHSLESSTLVHDTWDCDDGFQCGGEVGDTTTTAAETGSAGSHTHDLTGFVDETGQGLPHENRPPYYALAFIMKLCE
jgi:microcystin-dependent protein